MKKFLEPLAWSLPSLVVLIATAVIIGHIVDTFHDATLRWTAIAAVLTAAALLVAAIGLPLAVYQLVALDRDLVRPNELRTRIVAFRRSGQAIRDRFGADEYDEVARDVQGWRADVYSFINAELGDDTEAHDFLGGGDGRNAARRDRAKTRLPAGQAHPESDRGLLVIAPPAPKASGSRMEVGP